MPHLGIDGLVATPLWLAEIICFFLSVFWRPRVGLYLLVPLLPLQTIRYRLHGYALGAQFIDLLLLGVVIGLKRQKQTVIGKTPLNWLLFIYAAFTFLSLIRGSFYLDTDLPFWLTDPRFSDWKNYVVDMAVIFFVTAAALRTRNQIGGMLVGIAVGSLLMAKGFYSATSGRDFSAFSYDLRDAGPVGHAGVNGLAALAAQLAVLFTGLFLAEKKWWIKLGCLIVAVASGYCVLFALSRGGYAAVLLGLIFLGLWRSRLLLVGVIAFLCAWQSLVPPAVQQRVLMTTDQEGQIEHSAASRLSLWEEAMESFRTNPIVGTGFNTYKYGEHVEGYGDSHNFYVKMLVETGVPGVLLFLLLLWKLFRLGMGLQRLSPDPFYRALGLGFSGYLLAVAVSNFFGDRWMYFQLTGFTFVLAGLVVRARELAAEPVEEQSSGDEAADAVLDPAPLDADLKLLPT